MLVKTERRSPEIYNCSTSTKRALFGIENSNGIRYTTNISPFANLFSGEWWFPLKDTTLNAMPKLSA